MKKLSQLFLLIGIVFCYFLGVGFAEAATGNITIIKNSVGGNDTFPFTIENNPYNGWSITSNITTTNGQGTFIVSLPTGPYNIVEGTPPQYGTLGKWTRNTNTCQVTIVANQNVNCTFTNTWAPGLAGGGVTPKPYPISYAALIYLQNNLAQIIAQNYLFIIVLILALFGIVIARRKMVKK